MEDWKSRYMGKASMSRICNLQTATSSTKVPTEVQRHRYQPMYFFTLLYLNAGYAGPCTVASRTRGLILRGRTARNSSTLVKSWRAEQGGEPCGNGYQVRGICSRLHPARESYTLSSVAMICISLSPVIISIVHVNEGAIDTSRKMVGPCGGIKTWLNVILQGCTRLYAAGLSVRGRWQGYSLVNVRGLYVAGLPSIVRISFSTHPGFSCALSSIYSRSAPCHIIPREQVLRNV